MIFMKRTTKASGFTLVEIMIALAISGIIMAAIYSAYISQQRTYLAQEQVVEMQQNIRSAWLLFTKDIRMAGYDPRQTGSFGFVDDEDFSDGDVNSEKVYTSSRQVSFTADLDEDGVIDEIAVDNDFNGTIEIADMEQISYRLGGIDGTELQRYSTVSGETWETIAEQIEEIEFNYILDDAPTNTVTTTPTKEQLSIVRSIEISILARAGHPDQNYTDTGIYCPASNPFVEATGTCTQPDPALATSWGPFDDNFRRRFQIMNVNLRNMGL